jgi:membrane peptidoglycan carboxypeptidase
VARALGITSSLSEDDSLFAGAQPIRPVDLAVALSVLANGGVRPEAHLLVGVRSETGAWLYRKLPSGHAALDPLVATAVTQKLRHSLEASEGQSIRSLGFDLPVAGMPGRSVEGDAAWMALSALPLWTRFLVGAAPYLAGSEPTDAVADAPAGEPRGSPGSQEALRPHLEREDALRRRAEKAAAQDLKQSLH